MKVVCIFLFTLITFCGYTQKSNKEKQWEKLNIKIEYLYRSEKYEDALVFVEKAIKVAETVYGKEHQNYFMASTFRAAILINLGRTENVREVLQESLKKQQDIFKDDFIDSEETLEVLLNLLLLEEDYPEAEKRSLELLEIKQKRFGKRHEEYIEALYQLIKILKQQGKVEEREVLYNQLLETYGDTYGEKLEYYGLLIEVGQYYLIETAEYQKAQKAFEEIALYIKMNYGENHEYYSPQLHNLGFSFEKMGAYEQAEKRYKRVLHLLDGGNKNPQQYAKTLLNLGEMYTMQERYKEAQEQFDLVKDIIDKKLGKQWEGYIVFLGHVGYLCGEQKKYHCAMQYFEEMEQIGALLYHKGGVAYLDILNNLGQVYYNIKHYTKAKKKLEEAVYGMMLLPDEKREKVLIPMINLASVYIKTNHYKEAEVLLNKAINITMSLPKGRTNLLTQIKITLAELYKDQKKYGKAESLLKELLDACGEKCPEYPSLLTVLGWLYIEAEKHGEAEEMLKKSLSIQEQQHEDKMKMICPILDLAYFYSSRGNVFQAQKLYLQAHSITQHLPQSTRHREVLGELGKFYNHINKYDQAINVLEQALDLSESNTLEQADLQYELATAHSNRGNWAVAEVLFLEALPIMEEVLGKKLIHCAMVYNGLGSLYTNKGAYDLAEKYLLRALAIFEDSTNGDLSQANIAMNNLGLLYTYNGMYIKAKYYLQKSLDFDQKRYGKHSLEYGISLHNIGTLYLKQGNYEKAQPLLEQALNIVKQLNYNIYSYSPIMIKSSLAILYQDIGQFAKSEQLYHQLLPSLKKQLGTMHPKYALEVNNFGNLCMQTGRTKQAEQYYLDAIKIVKKGNNNGIISPHYVSFVINLAQLYTNEANYVDALALLNSASKIWEKNYGLGHPDYSILLNNIGLLNILTQNWQNALVILKKALKIEQSQAIRNIEREGLIVTNIAGLYALANQAEKGVQLLEQEIYSDYWKSKLQEHHPQYIIMLNHLALLYNRLGNYSKMNQLQLVAVQKRIEQLKNVYSTFSEDQRMRFWEHSKAELETLYSFGLYSGRSDSLTMEIQNLRLIISRLSLEYSTNINASILYSKNIELQNAYNNWLLHKNKLGQGYLLSEEEQKKSQIDVNRLKIITDSLEQVLALTSNVFAKKFDPNKMDIDFSTLKKSLQSGEAAIDLFFSENLHLPLDLAKGNIDTVFYYAFITTSESKFPICLRLGTKEELEKLMTSKVQLQGDNYINSIRKSNDLYKKIFPQIKSYLKGIKTIHFSIDGSLAGVAFETLVCNLPKEEGGKAIRLMDKYEFQNHNTLRDFVFQRQGMTSQKREDNKKIILLGGVNYGKALISSTKGSENEKFDHLKETQKEVEDIYTKFKKEGWTIDSLTGKKATENQIIMSINRDKPKILHFATHGFFFSKPKKQQNLKHLIGSSLQQRIKQHEHSLYRSGLALSGANKAWTGESNASVYFNDGILTAYEVALMDLHGIELVVLSACETGLGESSDTEGIYGLQRAFKQAGVEKLIVSLWKVPDQQTQELIGYFYDNYLSGQPIHEALKKAKDTMRQQYENPYYWAAFILIE